MRVLGVLLVAALASCATARIHDAAPRVGTLLRDTVDAPSLVGNRLGDPARREAVVYLPPSYRAEPRRRYPVLYFLHGFDAPLSAFETGRLPLRALMDSLGAEMIVVVPDARNRYGGAFYTDSPVAGGWEMFVVRDLVAHVDRRFRTRPRAASRGIAGHSMGGYGAIRLAARHPEVFGAAYGMSPCCWGPRMLDDLRRAWPAVLAPGAASSEDFWVRLALGLGTALTPDPGGPPPFVRLDDAARAEWAAHTPGRLVRENAAGLRRLRALGFDVGRSDGFTHVLPSLGDLSAALDSAGVRHRFDTYPGDHVSGLRPRFASEVVPFFASVLGH